MDKRQEALDKHKEWKGKIEVVARAKAGTPEELAIAYTPGVAEPCKEIEKDESLAYEYTRKGNMVAVITNGTAVLGLGDIGPSAGMPVMEGKCVLFKEFADVDAIPICLDTKDVDEMFETIKLMSKSFGGINLEDIAAPECFELEDRLKEELDIPVFHDDQHGTAIITLAGLINACKVVGKEPKDTKTVISGAGAAGVAIANLMLQYGFEDITLCNSKGTIFKDGTYSSKQLNDLAQRTNPANLDGSMAEALEGADIFLGVSAPGVLTQDMVRSMNDDAIIFAMANPVPEIMPDEALEAGAKVVATGRSDFPNQINNVSVFPGIFRGALDARATKITDEMKLAAAEGLAGMVGDRLAPDFIVTSVFEEGISDIVSEAVKNAVK